MDHLFTHIIEMIIAIADPYEENKFFWFNLLSELWLFEY